MNTGPFYEMLFFPGRHGANTAGDTRAGPPGYREHTCMHTRFHSLAPTHIWTNKEFKRFILSAADICGSSHGQNWFNLAAWQCAWQAQTDREGARRHTGGTRVGKRGHTADVSEDANMATHKREHSGMMQIR